MLADISTVFPKISVFLRGILEVRGVWFGDECKCVMFVGMVVRGLRFLLGEFWQPFGVSNEEALLGDKALCRQETNTNEHYGAQMNFI